MARQANKKYKIVKKNSNTCPVDIVVTYCDPLDVAWRDDYEFWKNKEISSKTQDSSNQQAFGECRTRTWGDSFRYWFRGIEKNCSWVNKIYVIVARATQTPYWLKTSNKVKIVEHKDFIPQKYLPTFNINTICYFLSNIKELSNNFILFDDDYYVLNKIDKEHFFDSQDNIKKSALIRNKRNYNFNGIDAQWEHTLYHTDEFLWENCGLGQDKSGGFNHLPIPMKKDLWFKLYADFGKEIEPLVTNSKFRHRNDIISVIIYNTLIELNQQYVEDDSLKAISKYVTVKDNTDYNEYSNYNIVCFNDGELTPYYKYLEQLEFFKNRFPHKSKFEQDYKLSIIIPCYNVEKYIADCINSIPKDKGIEIICIDDCSIDNTYKILQSFNHIKLIKNKHNYGTHITRNRGLNIANGDFIMFLDGDDYVDTKLFKELYDKLDDKDIYYYDLQITDWQKSNNKRFIEKKGLIKGIDAPGLTKIYKKDFIGKTRFPLINYGEDRIFFLELIKKMYTYEYFNKPVYQYRYPREDSLDDLWENKYNKAKEYRHDISKLQDCKFLVEATDEYGARCMKDFELHKIPKAGEQWLIADATRVNMLMYNNKHQTPFIYLIDIIDTRPTT